MNEKSISVEEADANSNTTTPLLSSPASYSACGVNNENQQQQQQEEVNNQNARLIRDGGLGLRGLFSDHTFSAAMMHSVGSLGRNEYVDSRGTIHLISIRRRHRATVASGAPALSNKKNNVPEYGQLQDLFSKQKTTTLSAAQSIAVRDTTTTTNINVDKDEFEVDDQVEGGSMVAAIFGVIKATVGPAILYLPKGFEQSGWACAIPALILATFAYVFSAHRLLQCWKAEDTRQKFLAQRMGEIQSLLFEQHPRHSSSKNDQEYNNNDDDERDSKSLEDDRRAAASPLDAFKPKLLSYPELARRAFGPFAFLIEFGIVAIQFGVCLTYLIFVPTNLYASCQALFGIAIPKTCFLVGMLLIEIPCTCIRDIRLLTPFNVLATIFIIYGLFSCLIISFVYSFEQKEETLFESMAELPAIQPAWFMFIGTAFFAFEGNITVVVPLQEAVFKKEDRERFPMINQYVTICIVSFYIFFAMVVWATFGSQVETALTASLPPGNFTTSIQFVYSIAVILTYPLQAFPAMEVVLRKLTSTTNGKGGGTRSSSRSSQDIKNADEAAIESKNTKYGGILSSRNLCSSLLNVGLGIIAVIAIDYLGNVVSLIGSLVGMPICLIYPPLMHNILVKGSSSTARFMNYFVSGVGLIATVLASYATITNWNEDEGS